MEHIFNIIKNLAQSSFKQEVQKILMLKQSGSYRKYFRIYFENETILGVYNQDYNENIAFVTFAKHFLKKGLNVPKILAENLEQNVYFIEDLGDMTLYDFLQNSSNQGEIEKIYKKTIDELINFQIKAIKGLDLTKAYPRAVFDQQSITWDLNYFKYFVLKIAKVPFDEQKLEEDFSKLAQMLTNVQMNYFLYRDFQSKNIMINNNKLYFIDFQGGRKGSLYYDLASLLYDSKAKLNDKFREQMRDYYYQQLSKTISIDYQIFLQDYNNYLLIRLLQAFGAYSFRGIVEKKLAFVSSISPALENINILLKKGYVNKNLTELTKTLEFLAEKSEFKKQFEPIDNVLVRINSFSFKKSSYPKDEKENGGGFVFDCRFLPNPGKLEQYKNLTGQDKPVIEYLEGFEEVETFVAKTAEMIATAARNYQNNGYTDLQVNFGCTGGQHRSVYCAQKVSEILKKLYNLNIETKHLEMQ